MTNNVYELDIRDGVCYGYKHKEVAMFTTNQRRSLAQECGLSDRKGAWVAARSYVYRDYAMQYFPDVCIPLLDIPEGVHTIATQAFKDCDRIFSVRFPSMLRVIEIEAFMNCKCMEVMNMNFGSNFAVQKIGDEAFCNTFCPVVFVPDTAKELGANIFESTGVQKAIVGTTILPKGIFKSCKKLRHVMIPSVKEIGDEAFLRAFGKNVVYAIPDNVLKIGKSAFRYTKIFKLPAFVQYIDDMAFADTDIEFLTLSDRAKVEQYAFYKSRIWHKNISPNADIDKYAFEGATYG